MTAASQRTEVLLADPDTIAPQTTITGKPRPRIRTTKRRVRVTFSFVANEPATFQCKMDGGGFTPCVSGVSYRVTRGSHLFQVFATDTAGNAESPPRTYAFRVKRVQ